MSLKETVKNLSVSSDTREKRFILFCAIVGIVAGVLAVAFRIAIERTFKVAWHIGGALGDENRWWLMPLMPAIGGLIVGLCISTFAKSAAGSGIPQTKEKFYNGFGVFSWRDVLYRFFLGALFCGSGNSAGREGPTVHMCSATASALAQNCGFPKERVRDAVPAGMGAGIAASFNAPMSAIAFVFEELLGGFGQARKSGGIIIAVVVAAAVARLILGENPVLPVGIDEFRTDWWMLVTIPISIISGFAGTLFLRLLLRMRYFFRNEVKLPAWLIASLGGLVVGTIAIFAFYKTGYDSVFSVGYGVLIPAFDGKVAFMALAMLLVFKFFATLISYSMGGSGGLFSPTLVIGGMLGGAVGSAMCAIFGIDNEIVGACVLLGMGSCFASIIRCPITSILMIFELTLNYSLILPLILGNLLAYAIAKKLHVVGLYDSLLIQDGITLRKMPLVHSSHDWSDLPISSIMTFHPVCLTANSNAEDALKYISENSLSFRTYPLVDSEGKFSGIISKKELDGAYPFAPLSELCVRKSSDNFLFADAPTSEAIKFFVDSENNEVAVTAKSKPDEIVGILTLHDIARYSFM